MKTITTTMMLLCLALAVQAAALSEDFSSLAKGKYGTDSEETVTLSSGEWKVLKMELRESSGKKQFMFTSASGSYLVTPALDDPGKIAVEWGSGGNNKLTISYSVDGGAWQQLTEMSSGGSGAKSYSGKPTLDGQRNVRFRFVGSSSNTYVTKITVKSANVVPVDPDDLTYVTEGVWVPVKAIPTAVNTYYISPAGNDETGDGTEAKPWYNIALAYAAA
jgi:hypothetical protein